MRKEPPFESSVDKSVAHIMIKSLFSGYET